MTCREAIWFVSTLTQAQTRDIQANVLACWTPTEDYEDPPLGYDAMLATVCRWRLRSDQGLWRAMRDHVVKKQPLRTGEAAYVDRRQLAMQAMREGRVTSYAALQERIRCERAVA